MLEEDCLNVYVPLIHRYPLESHFAGPVAQVDAEAQAIFRSNRYYHTRASFVLNGKLPEQPLCRKVAVGVRRFALA